jgi:hypothetical protein
MSTERALVPLDADLEEDTDLPPPAPGLRSPIADHSFDPPTLPGIVAPHRMVPLSDRAVDSLASHELSAQLAAHHFPSPGGAVPYELRDEKTLQMPAPLLALAVPEPTPPVGLLPAALPPPPSSGNTPTPAPSDLYSTLPGDSTYTSTQSDLTLPELAQLPALPPTPEHDSLLAGLRYGRAVWRSLRKRARLQEQLREKERAELQTLDRALLRLGQRVYTDQLELLSWHPLLAVGNAAAPETLPEGILQQRVETAAARLQALAQTELAARRTREAQLASQLLQHGQQWRRRQSDLFALKQRTRGLPPGHPLYYQRQEAAIAVAQELGEVDEAAQQLGQARAELLTCERIFSHAQPPLGQLAVALSPRLAAAQRKSPHLLVLGALLCTAGLGVEPPGVPAASYASLWQRLFQLQGNLALRQTLMARLELDQKTYDRDAIRRTLITLAVLAGAVLCSIGLVLGVLSSR